jgi:O-antigen/teichoic acid export membrane protein
MDFNETTPGVAQAVNPIESNTPTFFGHITQWVKHPGFNKYFRNTSWPFVARIISLAVSFVVSTYVARYLGPANYGELSYSVSFINIFSFIASLGIDQVIYRDFIKFPEKRGEYVGTALVLKFIAGLVATVFCIVFGYITSRQDVSFTLITILAFTFVFNSFSIIIYEFQAQVESKYPSLVSIADTVVLNILKVIVVIENKGVIYLAIILLFEPILIAGLLIYYRTKRIGSIRTWVYNKTIAKTLLKDSFPLIFSAAFSLIYGRIDQVLIKNMIDAQSVGLYGAAVQLTEVWYLVPNILVGSFFPAIVNAKAISENEYVKRLGWLSGILLFIAVAIALPTTFIAPFVMNLVFGAAFVAGSTVLQIYIWSNIGTFLANIATSYLINENMRFTVFVSSCVGMVVNVVLNLILIPHYGIEGSAFATLISYSLIPVSLLFFTAPRQMIFKMLHLKHAIQN